MQFVGMYNYTQAGLSRQVSEAHDSNVAVYWATHTYDGLGRKQISAATHPAASLKPR